MEIDLPNVKICKECKGTNFKLGTGNNKVYVNCSHCGFEEEYSFYKELYELWREENGNE